MHVHSNHGHQLMLHAMLSLHKYLNIPGAHAALSANALAKYIYPVNSTRYLAAAPDAVFFIMEIQQQPECFEFVHLYQI